MADTIAMGSLDEFPENSIQRSHDFGWNQRYPQPKPPKNKKIEIFSLQKFSEVDKTAKQVSIDSVGSIQDLVRRLTTGLKGDLMKLRALFSWLGDQDILHLDLKKIRIENTVKGYMKIVKDDRSTYTEVFAVMCRDAGIPCVILSGPAKGAQYDVGDMKEWRSSWNAVFVADSWRIVHPQWAFSKLTGHESMPWLRLESNEERVYKELPERPGTEEQTVDEFFFLADPEMFIHFCCPDDPKWQLLKNRISKETFLTLPFVHPLLFKTGITFKRFQSCIQKTSTGEARISLFTKPDSKVKLAYDFDKKVTETDDPSDFKGQESLVIKSNTQSDGTLSFYAKCFRVGEYRLRIYRDLKGQMDWLCDFKINCAEFPYESHALPFHSEIGWGPGPLTRQLGMINFSHPDGVIIAHGAKMVELSFKMTRTLFFQVHLKHHRLPDNDLLHSSRYSTRYDNVTVSANLPEDGLYVLKISASRNKEKTDHINVLNYVIESDPVKNKFRGRDNPAQKKARKYLQESMQSGNRTVLAIAIDRFKKSDAEDKTDLTAAMEILEDLAMKEDLKFAMLKNRWDKLDDAIHRAQNSPRSDKFYTIVKAATEQKSRIQQAPEQKPVAKVTKRTVADLKTYKTPPTIVFDVLKATYLILGEKELLLDSWANVRPLLYKTGKESLEFRLQKDPGFEPDDKEMLEKEERAKEILDKYDVNTIGKHSPAGASVYLQTLDLLEKRRELRSNCDTVEENEDDAEEDSM